MTADTTNDLEALIALYILFWVAVWYGLDKITRH